MVKISQILSLMALLAFVTAATPAAAGDSISDAFEDTFGHDQITNAFEDTFGHNKIPNAFNSAFGGDAKAKKTKAKNTQSSDN